MADALLVMTAGRIEDRGPSERVFRRPATLAAARVVGRRNLLPSWRNRDGLHETAAGILRPDGPAADGATVMLREEELGVEPAPDGDATIEAVQFAGSRTTIVVRRGDALLHVELRGASALRLGERVRLRLDRAEPVWYSGRGDQTPYP
ncbi:MAG: TOBE domain-containing protein [Euryarchaeota archaeon]|nr:TOBE domain-containing protein [Euryarchaeota archaeon]